jgi:hypothetical protein
MTEIVKLLTDAARLDSVVSAHYAKHGIAGVRVVARDGKFELWLSHEIMVPYDSAEELEAHCLRFGGAVLISLAPE